MPITMQCPFFTWEEKGKVHCEGATMKFDNADAREDYISRFCANLSGWKGCTVAANLQRDYERREAGEKKTG